MLTLDNIIFSYSGKPPYQLSDVSLKAEPGDYISIIGDNGSGKSTLVKLMLGLIKPLAGNIRNTFRMTAYVPQRVESLNSQFPITVREVLECYRVSRRVRNKTSVLNCLALVGMEDYAGSLIGSLSGGQTQRIFIARALIGDPDLIILDEPSSGVDAASRQEIYALLKNMNTERSVTVVSVEHNLQAAVKNSTAIYHLSQGSGHICSPKDYLSEYLKQNRVDDV